MAIDTHFDILKQDLRYTARSLTRARGFALTAILLTALGVGANTAAFSVADFVLLRPLAFPDADTLVRLCEGPREGGGWGCMNQLSPANYRDLKSMSSSFEAMGAFTGGTVNLVGGGEPRRLATAQVTQEVLPVLGVKPVLGRVFESAGPDDTSAAVISYGLWQSQFGGSAAVLGQKINLSGAPYTIIGVMPRSFYFPGRDVQMWTMLTLQAGDFADRTNSFIEGVGRLKPGVTFEQARAELSTLAERLARDYPQTNAETGVSFYRMRDNMSPRFRLMLLSLGGATLCLLLLTCSNLANLLLVRAASQEREMAVRTALGAGRQRLMRQLITQSVVLTLLGGLLGVLIAALTVPLFSTLVPPTLPLDTQPSLDLRVLAVAALFTGLTGLGFGLLPALRAGHTGFTALREGGRASGGRKQRVRAVLVAIEVTMSVILLITSGLMIRAVWRVQAIDPGFKPQHVLTLRTALPRPKYDSPVRRGEYYDRVLTRVRALPGVQSAAFISGLPMVMTGLITGVDVPGQDPRTVRSDAVTHRWVTPQYFRTMGIPLRRGRDVEEADTRDRAWTAVVSASFAERYWPGQDPIGKTFRHRAQTRTVVGVVGNVKVRGLERNSEPQIYLPAAQITDGFPSLLDPKDLVIRHAGDDEALVAAVRRIVREVDPEQPISDVRAMDDVLAGDTASRRAQLQVLGVLAGVAVLLSAVGIYGLLAYTVSQRSQEIGVRLALGADPARVGRMILADGMRMAVIGIVPGVLGAYAAARAMSTLLFGVAPDDPATFAAAVGVALLMTFAGSLVPALRAVRVSPMSVLRAE
ncbi:MAG TPA: ABC transporter permease [Vicinamibacterales bacterium]|nr:ABC transporter permease [Vicinamibacterales bacterium]